MRAYTIGYSGRTVDDLKREVNELRGLLIDCRYSAGRPQGPFFPNKLVKQFGPTRYMWVRSLGNSNYRNTRAGRGPIQIEDLDGGLRRVQAAVRCTGRAPIFMCACSQVAHCHRLEIAAQWRKVEGGSMVHL